MLDIFIKFIKNDTRDLSQGFFFMELEQDNMEKNVTESWVPPVLMVLDVRETENGPSLGADDGGQAS